MIKSNNMTKQTETLGSFFHSLSQTQAEKLNIYTEHQVWHPAHTYPIIRALLMAQRTVIWVSCPQGGRPHGKGLFHTTSIITVYHQALLTTIYFTLKLLYKGAQYLNSFDMQLFKYMFAHQLIYHMTN